jgi:hypothetical protein
MPAPALVPNLSKDDGGRRVDRLMPEALKMRDVIPAKAGIHLFRGTALADGRWIPAFAGMTPWIWWA